MLNLEYILIGKLPETERDILLENLKTEREYGRKVLEWDSAKKHIQEGALAEKAILVSEDAKELSEAQRIGMAALCYLMPEDGRTQREETAGEMEVTSPADMYAEGMEEIDGSFLQHVYERHHRIPWIILKTPRCIVKEFSMEYLDALFELYAGKGMTDYMEPLYPYEEEREYQQAYIEQMYRFYGYGMWIVCDRNTGELLGRAGVEHREVLRGELEERELCGNFKPYVIGAVHALHDVAVLGLGRDDDAVLHKQFLEVVHRNVLAGDRALAETCEHRVRQIQADVNFFAGLGIAHNLPPLKSAPQARLGLI